MYQAPFYSIHLHMYMRMHYTFVIKKKIMGLESVTADTGQGTEFMLDMLPVHLRTNTES